MDEEKSSILGFILESCFSLARAAQTPSESPTSTSKDDDDMRSHLQSPQTQTEDSSTNGMAPPPSHGKLELDDTRHSKLNETKKSK